MDDFGLILTAVVLLGTRRAHPALVTALIAFLSLALLDHLTLELWMGLRRWIHLGPDTASAVVDSFVAWVEVAGWLALAAWPLLDRRPRPPPAGPAPPGAGLAGEPSEGAPETHDVVQNERWHPPCS